jgi:HTH-type transcriptional regulator/antitoxin MqsA
VRGDFCAACGESVLAAAEASRVSAAMLEFNKQVNASIVDPSFIARVRKKLALDQREAAAIFGGGPNAFSRYENGKTKPPLALVKLLMVLDRHPSLLGEVRAGR